MASPRAATEAAQSQPPPSPKSPPTYLDVCGRHRMQVGLQTLNREIGFLEALKRAIESDWLMLLEEVGLWIPAEVVNKEIDDKPENEQEPASLNQSRGLNADVCHLDTQCLSSHLQDWILQYDPPDEPKEYIHRVGRTARGEGGRGRALLFLIPEEMQFLSYLKAAKVPLKEYEFDTKKLANVQSHLEKLVETNYHLNQSARDAYKPYMLAYNSHSMKDVFNVHRLDVKIIRREMLGETRTRMTHMQRICDFMSVVLML
ncbi:hypothetical protein Taro_036049 [Colocasia esculenta]|uniref:ATP-dependent rRNA helicase SPB4-like C-terminal extension domain-containing protein n=1 Tax=Colocasia esculenta TaxID=4460 RepID=A0A843WF56_COLES|nr:hypothetical protein [Colocasia esculenta]